MGKKKPSKTQKREQRLQKARQWLPAYSGTKVVKAYRKRFGVDTACAIRDLQELGFPFQPGYIENLKKAEEARLEQLRAKKERDEAEGKRNDYQNDYFYYIAGYTSGGAPYGVTWEEMGLEPYENEYADADDGDIVCCRHYAFIPQREQDVVNSRLREGFSEYVLAHRRLPSRHALKGLIEPVFATAPGGPLLYSNDFHAQYRKIVRKRENAFIREGVLPKRFTPTERKTLLAQSVMLETERLRLRKLTADDFDDLARMMRDPQVMYAWEHTFTDTEISKWIEDQHLRYRDHIVGYFAAIEKETGAFIGQMGLMWSDIGEVRALEIGYMLNRGYWGKGFATEGAQALAGYAFERIGVNKVYAAIRPGNENSVRVARRIGMTAEGSYMKYYNGTDMEHTIYSLDREKPEE